MKPGQAAARSRALRMPARRALLALAGLLAIGLALFAGGEWQRRRDARAQLRALHGSLIGAQEQLDRRDAVHAYHTLHLSSDTGVAVTASLKVPLGEGPHPALLVLGGLRTGRRTVDHLGETQGLVVLGCDYPYAGKRERLSAWEFLRALPRIRQAMLETVPALMLGVDYLLTREDVDPARIAIVGGSLGALFVPAAAALDERLAAAAVLFGAGDLQRLARAGIKGPAPLAAAAAWAIAVLAAPVEPLRYIADVSPRPLFLLSGTGDARVPQECSRALHQAAREPKTVRWIDAGHLSVHEAAFRELVSAELLDWLIAEGIAGEARQDPR